MLTKNKRAEMIDKIRSFPKVLENLVEDLSDEQLNTPCGEGEWTIRQIVHHTADAHLNGFVRIKLLLTEENPILKPYNQDRWAKLPDTTNLPIQSSLLILRGLHERMSLLLEKAAESDWVRTGIHLDVGKVSLESLLETYVQHGKEHCEQILRGLKVTAH